MPYRKRMIHSMPFVSEQVKRVDVQFAVTDIYCMDECSKYVFNVHTNISSVAAIFRILFRI